MARMLLGLGALKHVLYSYNGSMHHNTLQSRWNLQQRRCAYAEYLSAIAQAVQQDKQCLQYNMVPNQGLSRTQLPRTAQLLYDIRQAHTPHELDWKYDRGYQDMNHATLLLWAEAAELTKTGVHVDWTVAHNVWHSQLMPRWSLPFQSQMACNLSAYIMLCCEGIASDGVTTCKYECGWQYAKLQTRNKIARGSACHTRDCMESTGGIWSCASSGRF